MNRTFFICIKNCLSCLTPCTPNNTPYCISQALISSVSGDVEHGLVFVGSNAYRCNKMMHVKDLMDSLVEEANLVGEKI